MTSIDLFGNNYLNFFKKQTSNGKDAREFVFLDNITKDMNIRTVFDQGCGEGRIARHFRDKGVKVYGIDANKDSIDMLIKQGADNIETTCCSSDQYVTPEPVDLVISWFTSFGFLNDKKNIKTIENVSKSLKQGGVFILDYMNRDMVVNNFKPVIVTEEDGITLKRECFLYDNNRRMHQKWTYLKDDLILNSFESDIFIYSFNELIETGKTFNLICEKSWGDYDENKALSFFYSSAQLPRNIIMFRKD